MERLSRTSSGQAQSNSAGEWKELQERLGFIGSAALLAARTIIEQ